MEPPFTITVYGKNQNTKGTVGDPLSVVATPRHNQQPTAALTVAADHPRFGDLLAPGARVQIKYHGEHLVGGMVRMREMAGPTKTATATFQVSDDWRLLTRMLGWPVPGAALTAQTSEYDVRTGPAETVTKGLIAANAVRLGIPLTVAPDYGRGATITVQSRFHPLADRLFPAVDQAGIGITVRRAGSSFLLDCYTPRVYPSVLTEASGVVQDWKWTHADPAAMRVVVGGKGEGTARVFTPVVDTARTAEYGDVIEVFKDATDTDTDTERVARGQEVLAETGPKYGLAVTLAETATFRYNPAGGAGVRVGDRVRLEVGPGVIVEDVLREATLAWSVDKGLTVTPVVGERTDDPNRTFARAVAALAKGFRDIRAR